MHNELSRRFVEDRTASLVAAISLLCASVATSAEVKHTEFSRQSSSTSPGITYHGRWGLELDLKWDVADWDVSGSRAAVPLRQLENRDYNEQAWTIRGAVFHSLNTAWDFRAAFSSRQLESDGSDIGLTALGLGTKYRINTGTDFEPYLTVSLDYYISVDVDESGENAREIDDVDNEFGVYGEAGIAYLLSDYVDLRAGVHYATLLDTVDATVGNGNGDLDFSTLGFGFGATWHF